MEFIHCADLHLGSPFGNLSPAESAKCREGQFRVFEETVAYAKEKGIKLVLLAGDVFEDVSLPKSVTDRFFSIIGGAKEIKFVIAPGNHDCYTADGYYSESNTAIPENCFIFRRSTLDSFYFEELNTRVYGFAFTSQYMRVCPVLTFENKKDALNILLCHGDFNIPTSTYCPISASDISAAGYDYAALGHIHDYRVFDVGNGVKAAYSGCTEGRDFGECGSKGVLRVAFTDESGKYVMSEDYPKFHTLSGRKYAEMTVELDNAADDNGVAEDIKKVTDKIPSPESVLLRVTLCGRVTKGYIPDTGFISKKFPEFAHFEIKDMTFPSYSTADLENDTSLRGAFYRSLRDKILSENREEAEIAINALKIGLRAIEGEPLTR